MDKWVNRMWYIYTLEYCMAIKRNEVLIHVTSWIYFENIMPFRENHILYDSTYCEMSKTGKCTEINSKLVVA